MHSKSDNGSQLEPSAQTVSPSTVSAQPWWRPIGYKTVSPVVGESASKLPPLEPPSGGGGTKAGQAQENGGPENGTDVSKETQTSAAPQLGSNGNCGQESPHMQHGSTTVPHTTSEPLVPTTQLELVGHSIACAPYPYSDPYYGGMMAAYGTQALAHPHLLGMHHPRMPLPLEMAEEPVYVNAKQYHGILRRRQSRAKAELEKKLIKVRKPYLHESRHLHAMRRARGCGGRFLNTKKLNEESAKSIDEKGNDSSAPLSTQSASSSALEPLPSGCATNVNSSNNQQERKGSSVQDMHQQQTYSNGNGCYQHNQGFPLSNFHSSLSEERAEEGDYLGQQRGSIPVNQAPNRALTIQ
ncbi:PREDICTED: nuclear transcription factor Y subunit A-7-like isoform X1 [Nelumbo nucifera]|uniref:Nuclear transcription factor Y subunit n=1 Tax=Nelumbo nucifera TaxID=4432 RepID=A0A1U8A6Z8_NELNU|nr:PREDICTED: nuclear transcription factor Y subunit A-7-like isoform X1 [Nelumbo nucifera]